MQKEILEQELDDFRKSNTQSMVKMLEGRKVPENAIEVFHILALEEFMLMNNMVLEQ